uniref:Uncharacterized protein n=1 Tax=Vitis vinifera TaxID=29760 RepID=A5AVX3_VITVI|nr:hypothetical protein VITISV_028133 [Vitis vinifera]
MEFGKALYKSKKRKFQDISFIFRVSNLSMGSTRHETWSRKIERVTFPNKWEKNRRRKIKLSLSRLEVDREEGNLNREGKAIGREIVFLTLLDQTRATS